MDLIQQVRGYSNSREEEEEFDEEVAATAEDEDIITIPREENSCRLEEEDAAASNYNLMNEKKQKQLELLDLSLGRKNKNKNNETKEVVIIGDDATHSSTNNNNVEKEHMFDKVVTPSDVGKLNRLVIPKQHAEKYFPLDSSSNEKGLLLNFEDRNGKLWRFRYSYWNSSQSYVMTKGWSRFVKDKKLDSGDIVSFKRGVGDLYRHRLYIDWKRRIDHHQNNAYNLLHHHDPSQTTIMSSPFFLPNHYSIPWSSNGRFYSTNPNFNYHQQYYDSGLGYLRSTSSMSMHERGNSVAPMIIDSVPVTYNHGYQQDPHQNGGNSGKMLRLFGVNMECSSSSSSLPNDEDSKLLPSSTSSRTSLLFDLDPSLQYRK